jgi:hypothetical protein
MTNRRGGPGSVPEHQTHRIPNREPRHARIAAHCRKSERRRGLYSASPEHPAVSACGARLPNAGSLLPVGCFQLRSPGRSLAFFGLVAVREIHRSRNGRARQSKNGSSLVGLWCFVPQTQKTLRVSTFRTPHTSIFSSTPMVFRGKRGDWMLFWTQKCVL